MNGKIEVVGLREFRLSLKAMSDDLPKDLRQVNKDAAETVAADARNRASSQGGALGKAAPSIKAGATQRGGYVKIGGDRYPFALGGEFGSVQFKQFRPWRGSGDDAGYALYPAKRAKTPHIVERYGDLIDELSRRAFPD